MTDRITARTWDAIRQTVDKYAKAKDIVDSAKKIGEILVEFEDRPIKVTVWNEFNHITIDNRADYQKLWSFLSSCIENAEGRIAECERGLLNVTKEIIDS